MLERFNTGVNDRHCGVLHAVFKHLCCSYHTCIITSTLSNNSHVSDQSKIKSECARLSWKGGCSEQQEDDDDDDDIDGV